MVDVLGREIQVGAVITYPGRYSSSLYVRIAVVRAVEDGELKVEMFEVAFDYQPDGQSSYIVKGHKTSLVVTERVTITDWDEERLRTFLQREAERETAAWCERIAERYG